MTDHIHTPNDGRPPREVYVNGHRVECVTYADTKRGEVWYMPKPFRLKKSGDGVYTRKLAGVVEVKLCKGVDVSGNAEL